MKYRIFLLLPAFLMVLFCLVSQTLKKKTLKVLVITGGHDFDHKAYYAAFDALENISYKKVEQPAANALIASPAVDQYDVLVFYDMYDSITPAQQEAYQRLLNQGKAMVFTHHALVSYQNWPEFKHMVGGKYYQQPALVNGDSIKSNYEHDLIIPVTVTNKTHPIAQGIDDFEIYDEVYGNCEILPDVQPLLRTSHPKSMPYLAWTNHYGNSEVVYIQLGHGPEAYANPNYRQLLQQAIEWSAQANEINK